MIAVLCLAALSPSNILTSDGRREKAEKVVARAIRPIMKRFGIPGMAVGIVVNGQSYVFNYGIASKATRKPVTDNTLFEIGSVSKTFTATLASYAQVTGHLSLTDSASKYFPDLRGSSFDKVSLLNLGTHTSGGLPLQVPNDVTNNEQLIAYFQKWKPTYAPGTYRTYSNPSIGMLGMIAAGSMKRDFGALMEGKLLPGLGLKHTYINVPKDQIGNYAQGYTTADKPVRMTKGVLAEEAYGVKTTAGDLLYFLEANMRLLNLDEQLQQAITATHTGYFRIGAMTQDLIWEQYPYPVRLETLLAGNSSKISAEPNPAAKIGPPLPPQENVLINKTGSTNGFAAYLVFVPKRKIGIVLLANKSYPNSARVTTAYEILKRLDVKRLKL